MKNIKKVAYIIMILLIISFIGGLCYKYYSKNQLVNNFSDLISNYKQDISQYDLSDRAEEYKNLIKECEQAIINKDNNEIKKLNVKLDTYKEELLNKNIDITNSKISELESIDISKLEDKDSILSKIEEIKKLREEKNFIQANELIATLNNDINNKLEIIKQEEAIKNIEGHYKYENLNKNGFRIQSCYITVVLYGENKLGVVGGHDTTTGVNKGDGNFVSIDEATKEDIGYENHKSGSISGNLDYIGNLTWKGFIWDDQGINNIIGDNLFVPTIPIQINFNNNELIVTIDDGSVIKGVKTLIKDEKNNMKIENIKANFEEKDDNKISEREALELVKKEANPPEKYQTIKITLKHNFKPNFKPNVMWGLPDEEYYYVLYSNVTGINFLVGRESGAVYSIANQGYTPAKLMKDKNVVQVYDYIGE